MDITHYSWAVDKYTADKYRPGVRITAWLLMRTAVVPPPSVRTAVLLMRTAVVCRPSVRITAELLIRSAVVCRPSVRITAGLLMRTATQRRGIFCVRAIIYF